MFISANEQNIKVSIIVPVYNVEQYLGKCLDTLVRQTLTEIEIICVNDGAKDDSRKILEQYAKKDDRILIVDQENQGLSQARNKGLDFVRGQFIMFVDSDDWIDLDTCEIAVKAAEDNNADLVFWSYIREFEGKSKEKTLFFADNTVFNEEQVKKKLHRRLCGLLGEELAHPDYANAIETAWGKLYSAKYILENNVRFVDTKEIGTEDALFNLYALGYVKQAVYIKKCMYHYRKTNTSSLTSVYKKDLFPQWMNLFEKMNDYIELNSLSNDYREGLNNRIALSLLGLGLNIVSSNLKVNEKINLLEQILNSMRYRLAYC